MDYMIINRLNTSSLQECYVLDFGRSENAEERVNAVSVFGANGSLRVSESAFDGYQREFRFVLRRLEEAMALIEAFKGQENVIEFSYLRGSFFYCDLLNAYYVKKGCLFGKWLCLLRCILFVIKKRLLMLSCHHLARL